MNHFRITSNYGHIHFWFFYIGWNNNASLPINDKDCGDEKFGFSIGNFYVGYYTGKWSAGFLDENGCLK